MKNIKPVLLCVIILIAACQKDGSPSPDAQAILTAGKWQLTDVGVTIPGAGTVSIYSQIDACITDNFYTFAASGTVTVDEGATKCNSGDPQQSSGDWKLLNNNTQLKWVDPVSGTDATSTVLQLDNSILKVQDTTTYNGNSVTAIATFTHIH